MGHIAMGYPDGRPMMSQHDEPVDEPSCVIHGQVIGDTDIYPLFMRIKGIRFNNDADEQHNDCVNQPDTNH